MMKTWLPLVAVAACVHAAAVQGAEVVGVGNFSHIVGNLERSIEFYGGVLGLEPNLAPTAFSDNPAIMRLGDTPGARFRCTVLTIPGTSVTMAFLELIPRRATE
jgi:catechol 2,3-dioxygenase-like lactoylglutathione lyase family enzyme